MTITGTRQNEPTQCYRVGTLAYTRPQVFRVFFWMLLGDFCMCLMETSIPMILPLMLHRLKVSNTVISFFTMGITYILILILNPIISCRSDRHRGPWGRRIPFLVFATPFVAIFLALIGFGPDLGTWFYHHGGRALGLSQLTAILVILGMIIVVFQFFHSFINSVYYYLFNDVVPQELMGRFYGLFRVVGTAAGMVFNLAVFGYAETHTREIFICLALVYMVAFLLMCAGVKEGQYPPPPPLPLRHSPVSRIRTYCRDCFSLPIYRWLFIATSMTSFALLGRNTFGVLFAQSLGFSNAEIGRWGALGSAVCMALYFPFGWLSDRIHPVRLTLIGHVLAVCACAVGFFVIHDKVSYLILNYAVGVIYVALNAGQTPLLPTFLPREKYGQFSSGFAVINAAATLTGGLLVGAFMDFVGGRYIYSFLWNSVFDIIPLAALLLFWRELRRYGGLTHYRAPLPGGASGLTSPAPKQSLEHAVD